MARRAALLERVDERSHERLARSLLGFGSLGLMVLGVLAGNRTIVGMGAILAAVLVLSRLIVDVRSGVTSSNWGTWRRRESRLGFQCNVCFWAFVTLLWFALGILTMAGWVPLPSQ